MVVAILRLLLLRVSIVPLSPDNAVTLPAVSPKQPSWHCVALHRYLFLQRAWTNLVSGATLPSLMRNSNERSSWRIQLTDGWRVNAASQPRLVLEIQTSPIQLSGGRDLGSSCPSLFGREDGLPRRTARSRCREGYWRERERSSTPTDRPA